MTNKQVAKQPATLWHCPQIAKRNFLPRDKRAVSTMTYSELVAVAVSSYEESSERGTEVASEISRRNAERAANFGGKHA